MKHMIISIFGMVLFMLPGVVFSGADEICCTWINPAYTSANPPQMQIRNADGTFADYITREANDPLKRGTFTIMKKWKDSEGNVWYQIKWQGPMDERGYELAKISDKGNTLELVMRYDDYPSAIDPANENYRCYTRH